MSHNRTRAGFNLIEVIACVMIVAGSLAIGVSLTSTAIRVGGENRAKTLASVSALTAAYDPHAAKNNILNGFYVTREVSSSVTIGITTYETVVVRVYETSYETSSDAIVEHRMFRVKQND